MKLVATLVALIFSAQMWAQPISAKTQAIYDKLTSKENRYDIKPVNSQIVELYYTIKASTLTIYEATINEDKTLSHITETAIPLSAIKSAKATEEIVEGGGDPDYRTRIMLKPGKKVTQKLYGDADKPINTTLTKVDIYCSEIDIARSFAGTVKNKAKIK